ncbi:MAG: cysteine desulfurase family protein [bacterium]|nr:cysteine desulfurase family protein [bacterium]
MVYLDYSATTPVKKEVLDTFVKVCNDYPGNSNSMHKLGIKSHELEVYTTNKIADLLKVKPCEIIYTSGASESNNLAIKGVCFKYKNRGKHIITTRLEHSSIIAPISYLVNLGYEVDFVNVNSDGLIDIKHLKSLLRDDTILVTINAVDSEIGIRQDVEAIGKLLLEYPKCLFHVDCTQAIGKVNIDFTNIDMFSLSAHKFYGLKGIGLLVKKEKVLIEPLIHGGKSTTVYRSGTPPLPLIVSLAKALKLALQDVLEHYDYVERLNKKIVTKLKEYDNIFINSTSKSIPYVINFSLKRVKAETFVHAMEMKDVYISSKSACSTSDAVSKSVMALTNDEDLASSTLRISLSHMTTCKEINIFLQVFDDVMNNLFEVRNENN